MEWWQILLIVLVGGLVLDEIVSTICKTIFMLHFKGREKSAD